MKATINRKLFLQQALPIIDSGDVSLMLHAGVLSVASFGNNINFRVPAHVIDPGQVFLSNEEWRKLVAEIQTKSDADFDLEI